MATSGQGRDSLSVEVDAVELTLGRFQHVAQSLSGLVREVADEVTGKGRDSVRWVISKVQLESPLLLELAPRPARTDIPPDLLNQLTGVIADGAALIGERAERPPYFNDAALDRVKELANLVGDEITAVRITSRHDSDTRRVALTKKAAANVEELIGPSLERFGTVEGRLEGVVVHGKRVFYIWETLTNRKVECVFGDRIPLEEVLAAFERRVGARGLIRTRKTGEKLSIEVNELRVFPREADLPTVDDIQGIMRGE